MAAHSLFDALGVMLAARCQSTSGTGIHRLVLLHERLHPAEDARPSGRMSLGVFRRTGKARVADVSQGSRAGTLGAGGMKSLDVDRLQFPANDGFLRARPAFNPGMREHAGRIDFQIFAFDNKRAAVGADAYA